MKRTEPSPEVNFTFVVLIVVIGLTIVLAIPYFLLQRRVGGPGKKGSGGSFITSFAEVRGCEHVCVGGGGGAACLTLIRSGYQLVACLLLGHTNWRHALSLVIPIGGKPSPWSCWQCLCY